MSLEDTATDFTFRQLEVFGSFSLVLLTIVIFSTLGFWWIIKTCAERAQSFRDVIADKDLDIKRWQDQAFEELRANATHQLESLRQVTAAIDMVERLSKESR